MEIDKNIFQKWICETEIDVNKWKRIETNGNKLKR